MGIYRELEEVVREAIRLGTTHLGALGPPGAPRCLVLTSGLPAGTSLAQQMSSGLGKSTKSFAAFGLCLVLISGDVENKQKTTTSTGHYVNRLVPKMIVK